MRFSSVPQRGREKREERNTGQKQEFSQKNNDEGGKGRIS